MESARMRSPVSLFLYSVRFLDQGCVADLGGALGHLRLLQVLPVGG
jgi:hypothetical protein